MKKRPIARVSRAGDRPPSRAEASIAGRALRTGTATAAQIRSMAGRIEAERAAMKRKRPAGAAPDKQSAKYLREASKRFEETMRRLAKR